jgi:predicted TIM-barrel fold metal-dependent hydrolase
VTAAHPWHLPIREEWLALRHEDPIEPGLPIVDAHHHLWDRPGRSYRAVEMGRDIAESGHHIVATVYMDSGMGYATSGPESLRSVGETSWVLHQARSMPPEGTQFGLGIVSRTDFRLGDSVRPVLEAHVAAGEGRFKGIRQLAIWDADASLTDPLVQSTQGCGPGLLADESFRQGFRCLAELGLTFDTWVYSPQLPEVTDLARAFPETAIVLNHCGTPLAQGVYAGRQDETRSAWAAGLKELGKSGNAYCKLGGLAKWLTGSQLHLQATPPSSDDLVDAWRPYMETCLEAFGSSRCMFESNFPQEKPSCSYAAFWNACKKLSAGLQPHERHDLFVGTAARAYRLDLPPAAYGVQPLGSENAGAT